MQIKASWLTIIFLILLLSYTLFRKQKLIQENEAKIATAYCSSCHNFPEPSLLPKNIWMEKVLPEMGLRLGIGDKNTVLTRMPLKLFDQLNNEGIYPNTNLISEKDWKSIVHFYEVNSPEKLSEIKSEYISKDELHFEKQFFLCDSNESAQTTMVKFIPNQNEIWMANANKEIKKYNTHGKLKSKIRTPSPVVDAINQDEPLYLSIGNIKPNEDRNGRIYFIDDKGRNGKLIEDSLHRPVQMIKSDIDQDGKDDFVILEFGFETGKVSWINGKTGLSTVISNQPGARNVHVRDFNKDGFPDLVILFAQGKEQVSLFKNVNGKQFIEKVLLQFPPVYGSSYLDIADIDSDGDEDFILSFGDNADYSIINKNYHGVGIYLNDGKNHYTKKWFYPSYGATKTITADFDNDGDIDMAMIGFFADKKEGNSFLYFEQKQKLYFTVYNLGLKNETWLTMDVNDMDQDGNQDIILGNFNPNENNISNKKRSIEMLLLRNTPNRTF